MLPPQTLLTMRGKTDFLRVVQKLTNKARSASPLTTFNDFIEYISLLIFGHDLDWSFSERHTF